jgi:hypothetical protein
MSRRNRHRFQKLAAANAVRQPAPITIQPIELTELEKMGLELIVKKDAELKQEQEQIKQFNEQYLSRRHLAEKQAETYIAVVEKEHGLEAGAISRGEWSIMEGHLVCQKAVAQPQEQQRTGTEG